MLVIGNHDLTEGQSRVQMALWSILAAPLMLGNDPRHISASLQAILQNREVIAVDQDVLGRMGRRIRVTSHLEYWTRSLVHDELAVVITHRQTTSPYLPTTQRIHVRQLQWTIPDGSCVHVRDLFAHADVGTVRIFFETELNPQDANIFRLRKVPCPALAKIQ